jgi:chemotaxis protein methyltransferase CheR
MATMTSSPHSDDRAGTTADAVPAPPPAAPLIGAELTDREFDAVRALVQHVAGISLARGKEGLVRSRLAPRLRTLGLADFRSYLDHIERDASGAELVQLIDLITTNKTSWFREVEHFELLQREFTRRRGEGLRIWSAGCSSGEEPYTIAIVAREVLGAMAGDMRLLATDLSTRILRRAREARYRRQDLADVPPQLAARHFTRTAGDGDLYQVVDATRALVRFARLNLMGDWPMRGPFDVIFCRNVMIYFDRPTQQRLVERFAALLAPGGYLFVGHSESLTALDHDLKYVQPAVYRRPA